jgi:flagellar hook-associated protein 2
MPTSSISGLASGLDTATIINQLMQLEAISQNRLKTQQSTQKSALSALQSLNTDVVSLAGKAEALAKPGAWQTLRATTSSTDVTATLGAAPTATSLLVTIKKLATAAQSTYSRATSLDASVVTGAVTLTAGDGSTYAIAAGSGSLTDLAAGINAAQAGVLATTVRTGANTYQLQLTAAATGGATSAISLTNVDLGTVDSGLGQDAEISVGSITATSSTNTFTDLVPGLSLTLGDTAALDQNVSVKVARDDSAVKAGVKALVDQLNGLLTTIDTKTANAAGTTTKGVLAADATARSLRDALLSTVFGNGTTSMATVGIQTDRYGKVVLDETAFASAYAADPAGVAARFTSGATPATDGWAARLQRVANTASDPRTGTLTSAITGRQSSIDRLGDDIDAWDLRLELRRTSLTRQYTALETALSSLQSQGSWLAGQISSLNSSSS